MREGIRRLSVAIKYLAWFWIGAFMLYATWAQIFGDEGDYPESIWERLILAAIFCSSALVALSVVWILEGFAKPDRRRD